MRRPRLTFLGITLLLLSLAGCDRRIESICQQRCACSPCTDADRDRCRSDAEATVTRIESKSCDTELSAVLTCLDDNLSCQGGTHPGTDKCNEQQDALFKCSGTSNPFATVCEAAALKSSACAGVPPPSGLDPNCPAISACQSECVVAADCDVLIGATFSQEFQDCITACGFVK